MPIWADFTWWTIAKTDTAEVVDQLAGTGIDCKVKPGVYWDEIRAYATEERHKEFIKLASTRQPVVWGKALRRLKC